jgi:hypothetical protein
LRRACERFGIFEDAEIGGCDIIMKLYHGTARALGMAIKLEGLNPEGAFASISKELRPEHRGKSPISKPDYVYFFEDKNLAKWFACGSAMKVGFGMDGEIFEIDTDEVPVEIDPDWKTGGSFRHKGLIKPEKLKSVEIVDCDKEGFGKAYWRGLAKVI